MSEFLTDNYFLFLICVLGLCLGSFYNVVILRSLSGESIVFPGSKCPKCGNKLKPWHNIPVLSYIFLKGRCAYCKERISLQYPLVEIFTMLLFIAAYTKFGISILTLFTLFWISCLIIMTATDIKEKVVDCNIAIIMGLTGFLYNAIIANWNGVLNSFIGMLIGILVIETIAGSGYLIIKSRAMGEADSYVAGALGAIAGLQNISWILFYGLIASMFIILPMFLLDKYKQGDKFTLICFIFFILSILFYKTFGQNNFAIIFVILTGIILAFSVLKGIKSEHVHHYIPYVPALSIGFLYFLFFVL